ncbi:MAG: nitrogen fixation protein [Proteobacteria bacterium]|nr:nitrogen fixation protein [Pseudomonadota bacterium]
MKIAVTSQNFKTITGHAGRARRFIIYEGEMKQEPQEIKRLDLPKELSFHDFHPTDDTPHPIDEVDIVITGGSGAGFIRRMNARGLEVCFAEEGSAPLEATQNFLNGKLPIVR